MRKTLTGKNWVNQMSSPWLFPLVLISMVGQMGAAIAHGVDMQYQTTQAISVQAKYDTGTPFANAQVTVYAPNSDAPWLKGTTDNNGNFTFTPDPSQPGTWQVKARLAGHGNVLNVPIGEAGISSTTQTATNTNGASGYTPLQKGVMAASIIWGAMGTALFFLGRKR
ncbi:carboxypeptidase regulatory-like domain-containing protein [Pantanalinema rosaneae CENA516]|uniref:carboxypeptidase regulatory-like domain-containing protein n=1 Tax=Pantanalinema rosaneae TaxID=1620701 RepID=UPI003D6DDF8B